MLLIPMDSEHSTPCTATCVVCKKRKNSGLLYADIEGQPYISFYCRDNTTCVPQQARVMTREQFFDIKTREAL
jgi:hypothetical protein